MMKLLNVHGAKKLEKDEDPTVMGGESGSDHEDDDLAFEEDMFEQEKEQYETEIVSIKDAETGEDINFKIIEEQGGDDENE